MPFVEEEFEILKPTKALFLVRDVLKCSLKEAQRHLDKQRLKQNQQAVRKSQMIQKVSVLFSVELDEYSNEPKMFVKSLL
ncbi:hypothetical protein ATCC49503_12380 [Helicobacter pylori]|nr:hypothetical protein ATCC49503_12380 [Helicobacter pylori]